MLRYNLIEGLLIGSGPYDDDGPLPGDKSLMR
jgi:hypothetical protein